MCFARLRNPRIVVFALALTVALAPGAARAQTLTVGGTGSGSALMALLLKSFEQANPGASVKVVEPSMGTQGGLRGLKAGKIDLAVIGRAPRPGELEGDFAVLPWVRTPLVLAASAGKMSSGLTPALLVDILSGKKTVWDDGARIRLVMRAPSESDMLALGGLSPGVKSALDAYLAGPSAVTADTDVDAVELIKRTSGGLGVTTLGLLKVMGVQLDVLPLNGVAPGLETMASGGWPLVKTMYLVHAGKPKPEAAALVRWLTSPECGRLLPALAHQPMFP